MLITSELVKLIRSLSSGLENFDQKTSKRYQNEVHSALRSIQLIVEKSKVEEQLIRQLYAYGSTGIKIQSFLTKPYIGTYEETISVLKEAIAQCVKINAVKSDPRNAAAIAANPEILNLLNTPGQLGRAVQLINTKK